MKMGDAQALCLICCYSFHRDTQPGTSNTGEGPQEAGINLSDHKQFKLFCKELELIGVNGDGFGGGKKTSDRAGRKVGVSKDKLATESFLALLESPFSSGSLEVCPSCLNLICRAMELRLKAEELECHVRRLQQEILRELKKVQGHMEGFYGEVKKIEETVRNSDVSCLESYISKKGDERGGGRLWKDVELFRISIFEVAKELSMFQSSLDRVTMTNSSGIETHPQKRQTKRSSQLITRSILKPEESITPAAPVCDIMEMDVWVGDTRPVAVKVEEAEGIPLLENEDEIFVSTINDLISRDDPLENDNDVMEAEAVESVEKLDLDCIASAPPLKKRRTNKEPRRKIRANLTPAEPQHPIIPIYQSPNSNSNITSLELLPLSNKLQSKMHLNEDNKPLKAARKKFGKKDDNYEDEDDGQSEFDESASDTGSNYSDHAHTPSLKRKTVKKKPNNLSTEPSVRKKPKRKRQSMFQRILQSISKLNVDTTSAEFANMQPFKKLMVCRAFLRQTRYEKEEEELLAKSPEERDIEIEHNLRRRFFVKYNSEEDRLKVGDVELFINEEANTLQCSYCPYSPSPVEKSGKKTREHDIERYLVKHIIAKHMTPLGCPLCMESFKLEWQYNAHLRKHKGVGSRECDICGKPCASNYNIQLHKWTHMNEEDKEEARKNGMKDPQLKHKHTQEDALSNIRYPCPTCGKTFQAETYLRQHERTHDTRDEIICPKCGKKMLRESYDIYHKHFACPGNDAEVRRVKCLHCDMTFKNMVFMKRHVSRLHSNAVKDRPCICKICGKGFKTSDCLWAHKQIHNPSMDWKCGCGRAFNQRKNWKRHEVNCKGKGKTQVKEEDILSHSLLSIYPS